MGYGAPLVRSLRKFRVNLYRKPPLAAHIRVPSERIIFSRSAYTVPPPPGQEWVQACLSALPLIQTSAASWPPRWGGGRFYCIVPGRSYFIKTIQRSTLLKPQSVPFWGQTSQTSSSLSPKRDCGSKGVNPFNTALPYVGTKHSNYQ